MSKRPNRDSRVRQRIAFAGGYSAGHIVPGLALHERLIAESPNIEGFFIGPEEGPERVFVEREQMRFVPIPVVSYSDRSTRGKVNAIVRMFTNLPKSRRVLKNENTGLLIALGSYVGVAPSLAALTLRIPVIVFEPNCRFGLANRVCAKVASELWISNLWENSENAKGLGQLTGVPMRMACDDRSAAPRARPSERPWRVLVLGGSRGHGLLNHRAAALWTAIQQKGYPLEITHICGVDESADAVHHTYAIAGLSATIETYVSPWIPTLGTMDFALTSAGAISLHEMAALQIPCVVVPLSCSADDHQSANAHRFCEATGTLVCPEHSWDTARLSEEITRLWDNPERFTDIQNRMAKFNPFSKSWESIQTTIHRLLNRRQNG